MLRLRGIVGGAERMWLRQEDEMQTRCLARLAVALLGMPVFALAGGCSSSQIYASGQNWQRLECQKIQDPADRNKCLSDASTSYEDYKRQSEAARSSR